MQPSSSNPVSSTEVYVENSNTNANNPGVAWWCRILVKMAAAIAGGVCFAMGIWTCISIHILSIVAGVIQIILAMIVLIFEVPVCCQFFQLTRPISQFSDKVTSMQRAFIFSGLAIIPVALYFTVSTVIGCGLVFSVGVIYGLMALGKKADRETMMARAAGDDTKAIVPNIELEHR